MVYYYSSVALDPPAVIYMGKDKFENEDLIAHGWTTDVWFHVDKMSSAHVYLRLPRGMSWDAIPEKLLEDCGQLVKANSIEGNKKDNIQVIYTPWSNLRKTGDMDVGQIGFHSDKLVKRVYIKERVNDIVNRLNKTKQELYPDLAQEKIDGEKQDRADKRQAEKERQKKELEIQRQRQAIREASSYDRLFVNEESMKTNKRDAKSLEDDFM